MKKDHRKPRNDSSPPHDVELHELKTEAKELRTNRTLMYVSVFLTVICLLAFFWLVGILDWRGSESTLNLRITYDCSTSKGGTILRLSTRKDPEDSMLMILLDQDIATIAINNDVGPDFAKLVGVCPYMTVKSFPAPIDVTDDSGNVVTSQIQLPAKGSHSRDIEMKFGVEKLFHKEDGNVAFRLHYKRKSLLGYTGLSERSFSMIYPCGKCEVTLQPPTDFPIIESSYRAEEMNGQSWFFRLTDESVSPIRLKMRNERLARIDHIIDSSIAALLGVAVGGIVNAYLALILLRRSHGYASVIRAFAQAKSVRPASDE
jgi:hypothetical protein